MKCDACGVPHHPDRNEFVLCCITNKWQCTDCHTKSCIKPRADKWADEVLALFEPEDQEP